MDENNIPKEEEKKENPEVTPETKSEVQEEPKEDPKIKFEDFAKVDLRVAKVIEAKEHPNADKLMVLQLDLGDHQRQIVAGIKQWYPPETMVGKTIIVVANLKPAKLRGEVSNGMLLAASDGDNVILATMDKDTTPGSKLS